MNNLEKHDVFENGRSHITYKQKMSKQDLFRYVKAVALPIAIFILSLITIQSLAGFGSKLIAPLTGIMLCLGALCAFILPSHRGSILTETQMTVGIYLLTLLALKEIISLMSGISSEMFMAAFNQSIPATSGSAISGWLQTLMWITGVMTPVGFVSMQVKRLFSFRKQKSKEQFMEQVRGIKTERTGHFS